MRRGQPPPGRRARIAAGALLVALVLLVFGRTARHGFVLFDDDAYIAENPVVGAGLTLAGARWAFGAHLSNWHPLTWLSHMLDVELFGMWPGGHHLTSVLLHAVNAALLCALLRALTGRLAPSFAAAALFAVHPLRVESVAWAAERKDVLAGLFWLLATAAYLRYARRPTRARYAIVPLLLALGLTAKPMLVTLPLVLLVLDWWPLGRMVPGTLPRLLREKAPLLALSAASAAITWRAQLAGLDRPEAPGFAERVANAVVSYGVYVRQQLWPARLAVLYPLPRDGHAAWLVAGCAALLAVLTVLALREARRRPFLLAGWLWYLIALLPVIGLVQIGWQAHADRYTYLPLVGVTIALVWLAGGLLQPVGRQRLVAGVAAPCIVACLALAASAQTARWQDGATLFGHTLEVTRDNHRILNNLAATLLKDGRFAEAVPLLRDSLALNPRHESAAYNLGWASYQLGRYAEASAWFDEALRLRPFSADTHYNAGLSLIRLERYAEAAEHFATTLRLSPGSGEARSMLDYARAMAGRAPAAAEP